MANTHHHPMSAAEIMAQQSLTNPPIWREDPRMLGRMQEARELRDREEVFRRALAAPLPLPDPDPDPAFSHPGMYKQEVGRTKREPLSLRAELQRDTDAWLKDV